MDILAPPSTCLRRLTHPTARMYSIQNSILCKDCQDHVKNIGQDVKEASPFRQAACPFSTSGICVPIRT